MTLPILVVETNAYSGLIADAYYKQIMGYDLSNSLATKDLLRALRMANKIGNIEISH